YARRTQLRQRQYNRLRSFRDTVVDRVHHNLRRLGTCRDGDISGQLVVIDAVRSRATDLVNYGEWIVEISSGTAHDERGCVRRGIQQRAELGGERIFGEDRDDRPLRQLDHLDLDRIGPG